MVVTWRLARFGVPAALFALALFASPAAAQRVQLGDLDVYIEGAMRDWGVPGAAVAIVKDDSLVYAKGFGVRALGKPEPVDERTLFAIGSTSKAFTAAALAMLVDEGRVRWDDRATRHLPGLQLHDPYATRELTVRDLLTHRSGLSRGDRLWYATDFDRAEVLRRVRHLEPSWSFRSTYGYQNIMFLAAGQIVEAVSGETWDAFVAERIFHPLGMRASNTSTRELRPGANIASPHARIDDVVRPVAWRNIDNIGPAGSINSNVVEMAQWLRLQLGEGSYAGRELLSDSVIREMHAPQMVIRPSVEAQRLYPETHLAAYGLAWSLRDYRGRKLVGHGGAIDGMRAEVMLVPEAELGIVVLTNLGGSSFPNAIVYRILDHYLGPRDKDWSLILLESTREAAARAEAEQRKVVAARVAGTRPSRSAADFAGSYADSLYGEMRVSEEGGRLVVRLSSQIVGDLEHWHFDTFRASWRDPILGRTFLTFRLDASGRAAALEVDGLGTFGRVREQTATAAAQRQP